MMRQARILAVILIGLPAPINAQTRELQAHTPATLAAVLTFFDFDRTVPLHAEVVQSGTQLGFVREKIVFTGARGDRVPGFLSLPTGNGPFPVVLLMHAGTSSKDAWWSPSGYEWAADLTRGLLESGYAVFAIDAQYHGERAVTIDYVPLQTLYFTNEWWASFRTMVVQTTADYRRALEYLRTRRELDVSRVATIGQSMGALTGFYLAAVEPAVVVLVSGAPAFSPAWLYPITPLNLAKAFGDRSILMIAGKTDELIPQTSTDRLFASLGSGNKELRIVDSGHQLPASYVPLALEWVRTRLR